MFLTDQHMLLLQELGSTVGPFAQCCELRLQPNDKVQLQGLGGAVLCSCCCPPAAVQHQDKDIRSIQDNAGGDRRGCVPGDSTRLWHQAGGIFRGR